MTNGSSDTVCAMDGDGVRCWGSNFVGAAGSNSSADVVGGPTAVVTQNGAAALAGVVDVAPGFRNFSVLRTDGSLWTWGGSTTSYAGNFGVTNVVDIGYAGGYSQGDGPRYLTSDGVYHSANTTVPVNCGVL